LKEGEGEKKIVEGREVPGSSFLGDFLKYEQCLPSSDE